MAGNPTIIPSDLIVQGNFSAQGLSIPAGAVTDSGVAASAAISASKIIHDHRPTLSQDSGSAASNQTRSIYTVFAVGGASLLSFKAWCITAPVGGATVTFDLKSNGTSLLSAPISLSNTTVARSINAATISNSTLVQGTILEVVIVATTGGGTLPNGVGCEAQITEAAQ